MLINNLPIFMFRNLLSLGPTIYNLKKVENNVLFLSSFPCIIYKYFRADHISSIAHNLFNMVQTVNRYMKIYIHRF